METPRLALGGVQRQLATLLDAARAEGSATVVVACGAFVIELSFADGAVSAETARDASQVAGQPLSLEDEAVLLILGWAREDARGPFLRQWHPDTSSADIADDVMRTAQHAYQCGADEMQVQLRVDTPTRVSA